MIDWCCIAAVNDEAVLAGNLAASPALAATPDRLVTLCDQPSASAAYAAGLAATRAPVAVFAHQDVYLPRGFEACLARQIAALAAHDPGWAVAGVYGISAEGRRVGRVWSSGLGCEIGTPPPGPVPVQSLDELLLIVNRASGIGFDPGLPGFHLYGTDIVQSALAAGHGAYAIDLAVVHNSVPVRSLRGAFLKAHDHMRRKWRDRLPIRTPVTRITWHGLDTRWQQLRQFGPTARAAARRRAAAAARPRPDPAAIARRLGYE